MFAADPRIQHIAVVREQVVSLFASLNRPSIAVPGKQAQEVQAFIVGARNQAGTFTLFVYLFLTQSLEAVVYVDHERLRLDVGDYAEAESDAVGFVESMGFMLDNLNFRALPAGQQTALMQSLPCFIRDLKAAPPSSVAQAPVEDTPQLRLARLLAAF